MVNIIDMTMGMVIGMILAPFMMKAVKKLYHSYRVNKILKNLRKEKVNERAEDGSNNTFSP